VVYSTPSRSPDEMSALSLGYNWVPHSHRMSPRISFETIWTFKKESSFTGTACTGVIWHRTGTVDTV